MKHITRSALVEHSAGEIYALVEAIESYPQFLPWCVSARVSERTDRRTVATLEVGMKGVRQSFTTENLKSPDAGMEMRLLEGPFRTFSATWRFIPLEARAAKIEFAISYEFSSAILARLLDPLFEYIADTMVDAFIRRADSVHGRAHGSNSD